MWKNAIERDSPQTTIWRMRFVSWIIRATDTPEYVILTAFPGQGWFRKFALILLLYYISCIIPSVESKFEEGYQCGALME